MDIATVVGLIAAASLPDGRDRSLSSFIDAPPITIVVGGTIATARSPRQSGSLLQ